MDAENPVLFIYLKRIFEARQLFEFVKEENDKKAGLVFSGPARAFIFSLFLVLLTLTLKD